MAGQLRGGWGRVEGGLQLTDTQPLPQNTNPVLSTPCTPEPLAAPCP